MKAVVRLRSRRAYRLGRGTALCVGLIVQLHARNAAAQPSPDRPNDVVRWKEQWPRFHWAEYGATSVLLGGALVAGLVGPKNIVRWRDGNEFDDGARSGLRLGPSQQGGAATASDVLMGALIVYPYVDAGVAWFAHDSSDVAWQMAMMNSESFAFTAAITMAIKFASGRERPYARECDETGRSEDPECKGNDYASSFLSGHAAMAFTGAGLVCAHHTNLKLYGGGAPDYLACVAALGAATATGMLRIAADRHYATDVLAGAALGTLSGYVLPNILHYRFGAESDRRDDQAHFSITPLGSQSFVGVGLMGIF